MGTPDSTARTDNAASDVSGAPAPSTESHAADSAHARSAHAESPSTEQSAPQRAVILSEADIRRTLDRIAHQILESVGSDDAAPVLLVGIPRRGVPLAQRLAARMTTFTGHAFPAGALDITLYRDDLRGRPPRALAETQLPTTGVDGLTVVLVDDVLYSGRTIRAAMDALRDHGRPAAIRLAVLVDRGHRQLPIRADYVGKNIPTAFDDDVAVHLTETDGFDAVTVERAL
ncbi:MAG: bifunctional pyr operon transcriptional regulator/uracil phosphoribosyltransferase PyrR [Nakamurella sp.]